ncbi:MAG: sulfite exporter TauE/SafE family protein [Flavobacteriales bacterium]|nr:sulfite exporter TauE/SafE family protein [Flavobacteriales bacterium]
MLYTALILGLVGSLHCLGMCGPIVLIVPKRTGRFSSVLDPLLYHAGRLMTYALLGLVAGLIGGRLAVFGGQQRLSLIIGLLILVGVLIPGKFFGN